MPPSRRHTDLPIEAVAPEVVAAVSTGSLVLTAEPGAGKTSVVPLLAAEALTQAGRGHERVVVLQPRRLAARAAAQRLAQLIDDGPVDGLVGDGPVGGLVGGLVGLTIRGERRVSPATRIEVVTEAILTNRLQRDPELAGVGVVVFDEVHERNLHTDLGLALALEVRATIRPDLTLVAMSATIDPGPLAALLADPDPDPDSNPGPAPVIQVPGRTFPVDTVHLARPAAGRWAEAVADTARTALAHTEGDVLVFVPGRREIDEVSRHLAGAAPEIIGLHGGSSSEVRRQVLSDQGPRRVVVATAVAETSVTLPRIEAVVDGGLARRARFDPTTGLGRLDTGYVTRFGADQRRGRAGRLGPGRCYRLWSEDEHRHLDQAPPPEITDGDPVPLAFELARWGDPEARSLPLLDHPGPDRLAAGQRLLADLGLVDGNGTLTEQGRRAGSLGLHPRSGALVLEAAARGRARLGAQVAALLDDDRPATTPDLGAELDQRRPQLRRSTDRILGRLDRNRGDRDRGDRDQGDRDRGDRGGAQAGTGVTSLGSDSLGGLLAAAWPDRVAFRRPGSSEPGSGGPGRGRVRFLLANGREGLVRADGPLGGAEVLVVAEADGEARGATIRRAVVTDRATVLAATEAHVEWVDDVHWDDRTGTVTAQRRQRLGAITWHRQPLTDPEPHLVTEALAQGIRRRGLDLLPWNDGARALRARLDWLHHQAPDQGWPPVDDLALLADLDRWLDLSSCRQPDDLARLNLTQALLNLLDWPQRSELDELAPTHLPTPQGRPRPVDYTSGRPVWAVRIQHLFGLDRHPTVGPHRIPVTVELLSPANRPAQVTTDLPGFWRGSYQQVRAELRGRYPKHHWPQDPLTP